MSRKTGTHWAIVVYPESLPKNWLDILQETGLEIAISPLHNKDINADGTPKKPHYHIILSYAGPTTYNNVKNLSEEINGTIPIKLENIKGMFRYHTHMDNPEKFQYKEEERILLNGFDLGKINKLTEMEIEKYVADILGFIDDNEIYEYADLLHNFRVSNQVNLLKIASKKTILFNTYITSKRHKKLEEKKKIY